MASPKRFLETIATFVGLLVGVRLRTATAHQSAPVVTDRSVES